MRKLLAVAAIVLMLGAAGCNTLPTQADMDCSTAMEDSTFAVGDSIFGHCDITYQ